MMRRLVVLAVLLLVPAANAALRPANGCPVPCSGQSSSPAGTKLLYVQPRGAGGPVVAYTSDGGQMFSLPAGVSSADGVWHVSARRGTVGTVLARWRLANGTVAASSLIPGRWALAGLSPDGTWAALVRRRQRPARTEIRVVDSRRGTVAHALALPGRFEVETISTDGQRLFLIEHLRAQGAPRYLVRLFDLSRERLSSRPLRGKGEPRVMAGYAWNGVASPDGRWLLTLYLSTDRGTAFVHALDLIASTPRCIFLPSGASFEGLKRYVLTLSPDGRRLYAANASLGVLAEIDLEARAVVRTVRFERGGLVPGARSALLAGTISRNGRTLYFSDGIDLWAYDAAFGVVRGPYRTGGRLAGFGFGAGDRWIQALRADGRMLAFDAATGRRS